MSSVTKSGLISSRRVVIVVALVAALVGGGMVASSLTGANAAPFSSESISDGLGDEGTAAAPGTITFTVTATGLFITPDTVTYTTVNGTAKAGEDYVAKSGSLTFNAAGSQEIKVTLIGDTIPEANETFMVQLSGSTVSESDSIGFATIRNDDFALTVDDKTVVEGNTGTTNAAMVITLSGTRNVATTVKYGTVEGTATSPEDFTAPAADAIATIPPNASSVTVNVPIVGDTIYEDNERFEFRLSDASSGVTIGDNIAVVTITDNDQPPGPADQPSLSIVDATFPEGNAATSNGEFTVTLSEAFTHTVTVKATTSDDTAKTPGDYVAKTGTVSFAPGVTTQKFAVVINGDTLDEAHEKFKVALSEPAGGAKLGTSATATGTITDDDVAPTASVTAANANEGTNVAFTITLSAAAGRDTTVNVGTTDQTATSPDDFTAVAANTPITIPAGATSAVYQVTTKSDAIDEPDETFLFGVAAQKDDGSFPSPVVVTGTIKDTNAASQLSIADASKAEGNEGESNLVFTVTLSSASTQTVTVAFATANGDTNPATAGTDYTAANGTVTFAPGDTSKTITVVVKGDTEAEANETFKVVLSNPTNATFLDLSAVGTITNDDGAVLNPESITTGAGPGAGAHVRQFDKNGTPLAPENFFPYPDGPGVRVARGDLDGDGHDELIVGPGPGLDSIIRVFTSNGSAEIAQIDAYPGFKGGVYVAAGDVDGDGKDEVITGAGAGGGPHVRTFALTGAAGNRQLAGSSGFMAADTSDGYSGGVYVAAGDGTGNGVDSIVIGLASNGPPVVAVWSYVPSTNTATLRGFFLAYDQSFRGGISVAVGDLDGDGKAEIVTGAGPGGGPHVRVFAANGAGLPGSAYAYDPNFRGGVNVAIGDVDGDGSNEIITAAGPGGGPHVRTFDVLMNPLNTSFYAYGPFFGGGVFLAAGKS